MAARRDSGGGGIAGVFGVLVVVGFIAKYIWFIVGAVVIAAVVNGVYYASRAALRRADEQRRLTERREQELWMRAERQRRWTMLDDSRAIYGADGEGPTRAVLARRTAELMPRLRDSRSGFTTGDGMHVSSGPPLANACSA